MDLLSSPLTVKQLATKLSIHHLALEMEMEMESDMTISTVMEMVMVMVFLQITWMEIDL